MKDVLRVNMSDLSVTSEQLPEKWAHYGGRALTSAYVYTEVPATADPLGPDNIMVLAPGYLGGTTTPDGGRLSIGLKSPLTGGIKESNVGGQAAHSLGRLGIAAVIIEGKPADPSARYMLVIEADKSTRLERVDEWAGERIFALAGKVAATRPEGDRFAAITIGPAGEELSKGSSIAVTDPEGIPCRFAGRGGPGAVMGSKGLKAIVISDKGTAYRTPADRDAFTIASRKFSKALKEHGVSGTGLPLYGTNVLMNIINEAGGLPTRNFKTGNFELADAIGGERQREMIQQRTGREHINHGCHTGCAIQCSRYWVDEDGEFMTKGPEYESAWSLGANCGIGDLDMVGRLDREASDLGLDTIEVGVALGVYMESGALEFGDGAGALAALSDGLEDKVLWHGAEAVGKKFGVTRIPVVKHQALPAYDPRPIQGIGVTYATTTMGADHTAGYSITSNVLGVGGTVDPLAPGGQADLSKNLQIATAMLDALGLCIFVAFPVLDIPEAFDAIHEMAAAFSGDKWDVDELMRLGKETLTYERLFNAAAGFTDADDRLPAMFTEEKLSPHDVVFTVTDEELDAVWDFVPETAASMGIA